MNMMKMMVFSVAAAIACGAFADAANTLITFSTPGPDKYADGKVVEDGERYALVWTADDQFDGFTTDGQAVNPAEKVIFKAALAKDGKCPLTLFQIDSKVAPQGGNFFVYLLDTRGSKDGTIVTGSAMAKSYAQAGGTANIAAVKKDATVGADGQSIVKTTAGAIVDKTGVAAPKITGFKVVDSKVEITVANIFPGLMYEVAGGLDKAKPLNAEMTAKDDNTIKFKVDKDEAKFFSIKAK